MNKHVPQKNVQKVYEIAPTSKIRNQQIQDKSCGENALLKKIL